MTRVRIVTDNRLGTQPSADLRSPGWFAKWPMIGILMFLIGSLLFGAMAYNLEAKGPLLQQDVSLYREFHNEALKEPPRIIQELIFGFFAGREVIEIITVILVLYFLHKRFWPEFAITLLGVGGSAVLWYVLSRYFERPRPPSQLGISVSDPSFPSGHVFISSLAYGLLAYLLIPKMPSLFWKWVVGIATLVAVLFIGYSRLFLGGHYLTDVLAGFALAIAWAGLIFTLVERIGIGRKTNNFR